MLIEKLKIWTFESFYLLFIDLELQERMSNQNATKLFNFFNLRRGSRFFNHFPDPNQNRLKYFFTFAYDVRLSNISYLLIVSV
jgi:hypothetical protein